MTVAFDHITPWTEEEYFALGETADRVELFDGSLLVSPAPSVGHQDLSRRLANAFDPAASAAALAVYLAVNVRLRPGRVPIPDLVISEPVDRKASVIEASQVRLICEITSTNPAADRVLKMHHYATAGIAWNLLVDQDPVTLRPYRLDGDHYIEHASAKHGQVLRMTGPVVLDLDPATLVS
jgi:Uma2 family endonuclease